MANTHSTLSSLFSAIADKIRAKTGSSGTIVADNFPSAIGSIVTLSEGSSDATASAGEILTGKTAYVKGSKVTGTMANQGAKTSSLNCGGSYTIPAGYHNGSGKITANSLSSQTSGTATASDVLSGKTAWVGGSKITGNIATKTSSNLTASGATVTVPAGYYAYNASKSVNTTTVTDPVITVDSTGLIMARAEQASAGYVDAGCISKATQQLKTQKAQTITPSPSSQTAVAAGFYTTGDVTVAAIPSTYVKPTATKAATTYTPTTSNQTIAAGTYCSGAQTIAGDVDLVASNIKSGVNIFGVSGTYTSDATATASDMASGVTAYVNGSKVTGSVNTVSSGSIGPAGTVSMSQKADGTPSSISIKYKFTSDRLFRAGTGVEPYVAISNFGDATAADVAAGKTFTSAAGLKVTGTAEQGWQIYEFSTNTSYHSSNSMISSATYSNERLSFTFTKNVSEIWLMSLYAYYDDDDGTSDFYSASPDFHELSDGREWGFDLTNNGWICAQNWEPEDITYNGATAIINDPPIGSGADNYYGYVAVKFSN